MLKLCKPSVICLLLVGAASSAPLIASSINTYDITFAGLANPAGIAATTGSFTYDSATQTFTNFIIDWDESPSTLPPRRMHLYWERPAVTANLNRRHIHSCS